MVDASRHDEHVPPAQRHPHPAVLVVPQVEVAGAGQAEADLFVCVQVLREERLDLRNDSYYKFSKIRLTVRI